MREVVDKGYHKLLVWQKGKKFVKLVYKHTEGFPRSEVVGLQSQLRRAAVSVLLNLVEGHRRRSTKEFLNFLNIAEASLTEVEACLEISYELGFLQESVYYELDDKRREVAVMLRSFEKGIRKSLTL